MPSGSGAINITDSSKGGNVSVDSISYNNSPLSITLTNPGTTLEVQQLQASNINCQERRNFAAAEPPKIAAKP